jgi:hypothetical protein
MAHVCQMHRHRGCGAAFIVRHVADALIHIKQASHHHRGDACKFLHPRSRQNLTNHQTMHLHAAKMLVNVVNVFEFEKINRSADLIQLLAQPLQKRLA